MIYEPAYRVLICVRCQTGVRHPGLLNHLFSNHPALPCAERRRLAAHYQLHRLDPSDAFSPPPRPVPVIPHVQFYTDGLRCTHSDCAARPYICRAQKPMMRHYKDHHQWMNPYHRGGSLKRRCSHVYPWDKDIACQQLFRGGKGHCYFEVISPAVDQPEPEREHGDRLGMLALRYEEQNDLQFEGTRNHILDQNDC